MAKIFGFYKENGNVGTDKTWYQSSNIKYSECLDKDNELKQLTVVFNNGSTYLYKDVNVNDYMLFREDASQGKALNKYIKANGYEYEKLDNKDIAALEEELNFRLEGGCYIRLNDGHSEVESSNGTILYSKEEKLSEATVEALVSVLTNLEHSVKVIN